MVSYVLQTRVFKISRLLKTRVSWMKDNELLFFDFFKYLGKLAKRICKNFKNTHFFLFNYPNHLHVEKNLQILLEILWSKIFFPKVFQISLFGHL
jgi:hypothetical protein